jgi:hypothetical protein
MGRDAREGVEEADVTGHRPSLSVLHGESMSADDAAWMMVADEADAALKLPGLSSACAGRLVRLRSAALRAGGQPLPQSPQAFPGA